MAVSEQEVANILAKIQDRRDWRPTPKVEASKVEESKNFFARCWSKMTSFCCETVEKTKTKADELVNGPKDQRLPFHPTRQNCSTFVQALCHVADIEMNADVTVFRLIGESFPPIIRKIGICIYQWSCAAAEAIAPLLRKIIPEGIRNWLCEKILLVWHAFIKLLHFLFVALPGKLLMLTAGDSLMDLDQDALLEERKGAPWYIPAIVWRYVHYNIIHPIGVRDFQLAHKEKAVEKGYEWSTYIYKEAVTIKETIVPPPD